MKHFYAFLALLFLVSLASKSEAQINVTLTSTNATCNGSSDGSITSAVTGGIPPYSYMWSIGASTANVTGLTSGSYSLTVVDANSDTAVASAGISNPSSLIVSVTGTNPSCNGSSNGTATATLAGGTMPYTYVWSMGQVTVTSSGLGSGTYTVTVTDANSCTASGSVTLTNPPFLTITITGTNPTSCGSSNGSYISSTSGGTPPYQWATSFGATTSSMSGLPAGTYTITVTDSYNCTASGAITLTAQSPISITVIETNSACVGNDGTAQITSITGGTAPYTYLWSDGQSTLTATGLSPGIYYVTVSDTINCPAYSSVTISTSVSLSLNKVNASCDSCFDGSATVNVNKGSPAYTYTWSNAASADSSTNLGPGNYCVTVTDSKGCSDMGCITINSNSTPCEIYFSAEHLSTNNIKFTAYGSGNTPPSTYFWDFGDSTTGDLPIITHTFQNPGVYRSCVTIYNSDLCSANFCEFVFIGSFCKSKFSYSQVNSCQYLFNSSFSEGNIISWSWDFGDGTFSDLQNPEHIYTSSGFFLAKLTVTTSDSCSNTSQQYLSVSGCTGGNNGCIYGCVYQDDNSNCLNDIGELHQTNWIIQLFDLNNNQVSTAKPYFYDNCFQFSNVSPGNYILRADPFYYWWEWDVSCPENGDIYVTVDSGVCDTVYFGANTPNDTIGNDLMVAVDPLGFARAGSTQTFTTGTCNMGSETLSGTLSLIKNSSYAHSYSYPSPIFESGDTLEWNFSNLSPGSCFTASSSLYISTSVSWGQTLGYKAIVTPIAGDVTPDNNIDTGFVVISGSYDPNDKLVSPMGLGAEGKIKPNLNDLTYTIRFQNTGNDTAFHIYVLDTLDLKVYDFSSLKILRSSHNYEVSFPGNGVILFDFQNVLLPDSNKNEPGSHGYIQYNIRLKAGLPLQTEIKNRAEIFFDYNPGVLTNMTLNTLDSSMITHTRKPLIDYNNLDLFPNPVGDYFFVNVKENPDELNVLTFKLFDIVGKERLKINLISGLNKINIIPYSTGMYFYKIEQKKAIIETGKLVKVE